MTDNSERIKELEWALECASRIIVKKQESCSRQLRKLLAAEGAVQDLKRQVAEKDDILRKIVGFSCQIRGMNGRSSRPQTISSKVSVVIPVKNGGEQLSQLLGVIRSQKKVEDVEIIVLDSESMDNSVQIAGEFGAKVITIPQSEFNHGRTRNIGAAEASGDYIVFTVQDATPVSNYWLYNMICPFVGYPELAALSTRQFTRPEADLFSLWANDIMTKSLGFEGDTIYSLSENAGDIDWRLFDNVTKRRLTFFDNVSSCVRRDVFAKTQFSPLINAEDIDFGVKLLEKRMPIGYLTSTGVYHWHEKGADDVFKRNYIGTKAQIYTLKNDLPHFFDTNDISWQDLMESCTGLYDLINVSIAESGGVASDPLTAIKSFINLFQKNMELSPDRIEMKMKKTKVSEHDGLGSLIKQLTKDMAFTPERRYNFKKNLFISTFMTHFKEFAEYLYNNQRTLKDREKEFVSSIYKIFAMAAGNGTGLYHIELEASKRLTPELKIIDRLLGKGVCYS